MFYNCLKPIPFPDGSVDNILCFHFLEHVYPEETRILVQNYHKILKPGGTLHVIVSDLAARAKEYIGNLGKQDTTDRFLNSTILSSQKRPKTSVRLREFIGDSGISTVGCMTKDLWFICSKKRVLKYVKIAIHQVKLGAKRIMTARLISWRKRYDSLGRIITCYFIDSQFYYMPLLLPNTMANHKEGNT